MGETEAHRSEEPVDRMTRMCDAAIEAFSRHPECRDDDRCIIFTNGGGRGGLVIAGYDKTDEPDKEAIADLLIHLKALFEGNGMRFEIHSLDQMGQG